MSQYFFSSSAHAENSLPPFRLNFFINSFKNNSWYFICTLCFLTLATAPCLGKTFNEQPKLTKNTSGREDEDDFWKQRATMIKIQHPQMTNMLD